MCNLNAVLIISPKILEEGTQHLENKIWLGVIPYIIGHESVTLMDSSYIHVKCYLPIKSMQPWVLQPEVVKIFQGRA